MYCIHRLFHFFPYPSLTHLLPSSHFHLFTYLARLPCTFSRSWFFSFSFPCIILIIIFCSSVSPLAPRYIRFLLCVSLSSSLALIFMSFFFSILTSSIPHSCLSLHFCHLLTLSVFPQTMFACLTWSVFHLTLKWVHNSPSV